MCMNKFDIHNLKLDCEDALHVKFTQPVFDLMDMCESYGMYNMVWTKAVEKGETDSASTALNKMHELKIKIEQMKEVLEKVAG